MAIADFGALRECVCQVVRISPTVNLDDAALRAGDQLPQPENVVVGVEVRLEEKRDTDPQLAFGHAEQDRYRRVLCQRLELGAASADVVDLLLDLVLG